MPYHLRDGLSFCHVNGGIIFLDVPADRYFQLPQPLEDAFRLLLRDGAEHASCLDALRRVNIIAPTNDVTSPPRAHRARYPLHSALEEPSLSRLALGTFVEVLWIVSITKRAIRPGQLKSAVEGMARVRDKQFQRETNHPVESGDPSAAALASQFHRIRPFVPIDTCCLLDSIAMIQFLARRRVFARLAFGVTSNPFSAHCWVQHGDMVLNDTVGHVAAHTPIWEA